MTQLKDKLSEKIQAHRPRTAKLAKEHADVVIDKVDIGQCLGGARDIRCLVTDISYLDPQEGIRFRGKTIPETFAALPKAPGSAYPTVESFWYFLLTGDVPTQAQVDEVVAQWKTRQEVPRYDRNDRTISSPDERPVGHPARSRPDYRSDRVDVGRGGEYGRNGERIGRVHGRR